MRRHLKCTYEVAKKIQGVEAALDDIDDQREEDPNVSFNLSMASMDNKLSEINDSLEAIELNTDHVLWKAQRKLSRRRTKLLQVKTVTPAASTESTPKGSYKLANLSIPKFHGKLDEWLTFWGEFELAINEKKDMSNSIKLVYLKQSILDPELKSSITDLGIGPKAYKPVRRGGSGGFT